MGWLPAPVAASGVQVHCPASAPLSTSLGDEGGGSQTNRLLVTREGVDFEWTFMTELDLSVPLQRSPNTVSVVMGETLVAMDMDAGQYFTLVGTGPRIWELLERPCRPETIVDAILAEFEVDELTGREETLTYLCKLIDAGLVLPVTG